MIWVTWRQHRGEAIAVGATLVVLALVLLVTGNMMANTLQQLGATGCFGSSPNDGCFNAINTFLGEYRTLWSASRGFVVLPALLGIFIGAPLVARELEQNTHYLAWTQDTTRLRWLAVKLCLVGGGCLVVMAIATVLVTAWRGPFDQIFGVFSGLSFDASGVAPVAYTAYAFALALAAGTLLRRTVPAMAVTLTGFLALRMPVAFLRPHFQQPIIVSWDPITNAIPRNYPSETDWVIEEGGWMDHAGHVLDLGQVDKTCAAAVLPSNAGEVDPFNYCAHAHGWVQYVAYQPVDRFWLFQGIESAIFVAATAALLALTIHWVRRRLN